MRRESPFRRTKKRLLTAELAGVGVVFALTGCALEQGSAFDRVAAIASPYSAPVRQGNWVEPEAARQLRKGMPQETVRLLLGAPLLVDPFRNDRWDCLYRYDDKRGHVEMRRLTLFFENGVLVRVEGDVVPANEAAAGSQSESRPRWQTVEIPAEQKE